MKYRLTTNTKTTIAGVKLHQIQRISDGVLGGWIEKETNLSQEGSAWVSGDACVCGNARVCGDARVSGNAWVYETARVYGNACVSEDAIVSGNASVCGNVPKKKQFKGCTIRD